MIPGIFISALTFPGVIVHEFGHKLMCELTDTWVREVCYYRFGNPAGYVIHDRPSSIWKQFLIAFGPLVVNSVAGLCLGLFLVATHGAWPQLIEFVLLWLAVSIAMHSFPSTGDAKSLWEALFSEGSSLPAKLVGVPVVGTIFLGALGSVFWLDLAYGFVLAIMIPGALVR